MDEKTETYEIAGVQFKLNDDLDIDQGVVAGKLMSKLFVQSSRTLVGEYTGDEIEEFLSIVLVPVKGDLPQDFSFRKAKESLQIKVFAAFFLARMRRGMNGANEFVQSMKEHQKH